MAKMKSQTQTFFAGVATVFVLMLIGLIPLGFSEDQATVSCINPTYGVCAYAGFVGRIKHRLIEFIAGDELVVLNAQLSPSNECDESKVIMNIQGGLLDNSAFTNGVGPVCMLVSQRSRTETEEAKPPRIEFFKQAAPIR